MPELREEQNLNEQEVLDQDSISLGRMLLLGLTSEFILQFILSIIYREVFLESIIVLLIIIITSFLIFVCSYKLRNTQIILSNHQYWLYLYLFVVNWMVSNRFGDFTFNNALAMGLVMMSLIRSKSSNQLKITSFFGAILYILFSLYFQTRIEGQYLTIFFTLFFGVTILQAAKIISDKKNQTFERSVGSVFNKFSEPIFILDKNSLMINYCNSFASDILKWKDKDALLNVGFSTLIASSSVPDFDEIIKNLDTKNMNLDKEIEMVGLNGEEIWVLFLINTVKFPNDERIIIKIKDITKTKLIEQKLKKSLEESEAKNNELGTTKRAIVNVMEDLQLERDKAFNLAGDLEKFRLAVDNASDHIVITDPEGITLYANIAASRITGYENEEIIGTKAGKLWSLPMEKEFYANFWDVIKNQKKQFEGEITNRRKNGIVYFAQVSVSPILDEKGNVKFFIGIERDITKSKEVDKMRTEFVSVASHQLRTPLTSIKWYLELLQGDENNLTDSQKNIIKEISSSNNRMISLVNDLLNVSRIERGEKYSVVKQWDNIITLMRNVIVDQQAIAETKKVKINFDDGGFGEFMMNIDKARLYQSLSNLINNAIKYSYEDSIVDFRFEHTSNEEVTIYVIDHGIGIPDDAKDKIFGKFYRADNAIKKQTDGNGLGLYFAKVIVVDHGGEMDFNSIEGKGTTFTVRLPIN